MASKPFTVTVHPFTSPTPFSCAYERGNTSARNALVYLGGLTTGPHTIPQIDSLVGALQENEDLSYSFWEVRMRSSYTGFGYSSLANDAEDIAALVTYLKTLGKERIVLLGSSTGNIVSELFEHEKLTTARLPGYTHIRKAQQYLPNSERIHPASTNIRPRNCRTPNATGLLHNDAKPRGRHDTARRERRDHAKSAHTPYFQLADHSV